jgi:hypothetical protein
MPLIRNHPFPRLLVLHRPIPSSPSAVPPKLTRSRTRWIAQLPTHFERAGLQVHAAERLTEQAWQRPMMMEIWLLVADEFAAEMRQQAGAAELAQDAAKAAEVAKRADGVAKVAAGAYAEIRRGAHMRHAVQLAVGQKAA